MGKHYSQKENLITIMTEISKKTPRGIMNGDTTVGHITWQMYLMRDYLKLDGTPLANASNDYSDLLSFAQDNNLITSDTTNNSLFKYDSTTDVLTLPNYIDLVLQGGNSVEEKEAGLPNIKGTVSLGGMGSSGPDDNPVGTKLTNGALNWHVEGRSSSISWATYAGGYVGSLVGVDASQVSSIYSDSVTTVQPPAITLIPQIKYRKATTMYEQIEAVVNYSTTEKVVGTWIDGKPLYQKTYSTTSPSTADRVQKIIDLDNTITLREINGYISTMIPANYYFDSTLYVCTWQFDNDKCIYMKVGTGYISKSGYITLKYTKTTD